LRRGYGVSISARNCREYRAISFVLGLEDQNVVGTTMNFVVAADGNQVYKKLVRQGSLSTVGDPAREGSGAEPECH